MTSGKTYHYSAWIYIVSTLSSNPRIYDFGETVTIIYGNRTLVGQWQHISGVYTATVTSSHKVGVGMFVSASTGTYIIDNVSVQELDIKDEAGMNNGIVAKNGTAPYPEYHDKETNNCINGGCFKFYGDDLGTNYNYVATPVSNSLNLKRSITLSAWGKITGNVKSGFIGSSGYFLNMYTDGKLYFNINDGVSWVATTYAQAVSDSFIKNWHYYVATYDYDTGIVRLYIDGELQTLTTGLKENNVGQVIAADPGSIHLGEKWGNWNMDGYIDEVGIYDKSLSQAEIKSNYISGLNSMLAQGTILEEEYNERLKKIAHD